MSTNTSSRTDELRNTVARLEQLLAALEPRDVPLPEVTPLWKLFSTARRLGAAGEVRLADRVREAADWKRSGFKTPEEWMARQKGTSVGAARDELAASKQLETLPDTAQALLSGELSPEQAVVVADAAAVNPDAERDLIRQAQRDSHRGLRREAARRKAQAQADGEEQSRRHHRERKAWCSIDAEGRFNLYAQGPVSQAAAFQKALDREVDRRYRAAAKAGKPEFREAYMFDALMSLGVNAGEAGGAATRGPIPAKHLALIRVDLTALVRGHVQDDELCEIDGMAPISVGEARALLGDSILKLVMTKGQAVQSITHLGRGPSAVQTLALLWQGQTCSVLGCYKTHIEYDHRIDYVETKHTRLDELDPLCDHHHDQKTYKGWGLVNGIGPREFVPPDHASHPKNEPEPVPGSTEPVAEPAEVSAVEPADEPAEVSAAASELATLAGLCRRIRAKVEAGSRNNPEIAGIVERLGRCSG